MSFLLRLLFGLALVLVLVFALGLLALSRAQEPVPTATESPARADSIAAASNADSAALAAAPPRGAFQPNLKPSIRPVRIQEPIKIDGELDEPGWKQAARAANFAQWNPSNMEKPPVDTEAWIAYDDHNLYVALLGYDDPKSIRASLRDRDQMFSDDFIGLFIDTSGDGSWAYEIWSNPLGVQGDILWTPNTEDERFDMVYESKGKITDRGYQVEMAIPFSSLRFPNRPVQTWGTTFWRNHPRGTRGQYSWAGISRNDPCWQCQWGTMTGIENVHPASNMELLPAVTASQAGLLRDPADLHSGLHNEDPKADAGLNLRYVFASNLAAEAAINPDFSQIESDVTQIDVNSTFALFYPEKRPFFLEGSDLFNSYFTAVYTRSVNDPLAAARFTGRNNRTSIAYVGALDEHSPFVLPFEESSAVLAGGRSTTNIFRMKQTFLRDSNVGILATDRRMDGGGSGSLVGGDGVLRFLRNYRLEWQALASHTDEPEDPDLTSDLAGVTFDGGRHTAAFDGESYWGHAGYASIKRDGSVWNLNAQYRELSPTFRAENGFETQNDVRRASVWNGFDLRPKHSFFTLITPNAEVSRVWNFDGVRKDEWVRTELYAQFKGQSEAWIAPLWSREQFRGVVFNDIQRIESWGQSRFSDPVTFGYFVRHGRFIARNLATPVLGRGNTLELWSTIKPIQRLVIEPHLIYAELHHPDDGSTIFEGHIFRTRGQYQFSRELFLRLIVQYDSFDQALEVDPLVSYKINPFTVAYLGSTHDYQDIDGPDGFSPTSRQLFMKLQYLFRM